MNLFLLTDIYGVTPAIIALKQKLLTEFDRVSILDPYQGNEMQFDNEHQAYSEFAKLSGHHDYLKISEQRINSSEWLNCILGFSAGASVCWRLSAILTAKKTQQIIAFYPSQIRHYLALEVGIKTTVIFPKKEHLFSVEASIKELQNKNNVDCHLSSYAHGFMNPDSVGYSIQAAGLYSSLLMQKNFFHHPIKAIENLEHS